VPEYLQDDATPEKLAAALLELLGDTGKAARQIEPFAGVHAELRRCAAQQAAQHVIDEGRQ
jgi:lipid-A-disaccharide synthase